MPSLITLIGDLHKHRFESLNKATCYRESHCEDYRIQLMLNSAGISTAYNDNPYFHGVVFCVKVNRLSHLCYCVINHKSHTDKCGTFVIFLYLELQFSCPELPGKQKHFSKLIGRRVTKVECKENL